MMESNPRFYSAAFKLLPRTTQKVWHRGEELERQGKVEVLEMKAKTFSAIVKGTQDYTVKLTMKIKNVDTSCTCPFRGPGVCKHIVASAIVWDKYDKGVSPPEEIDIKHDCMPEPDNSGRNKLREMYADPGRVNLDDLRNIWALTGAWTRPHAKIPPEMPIDIVQPYFSKEEAIEDLKKDFKRLMKYTKRRNYDPYFCAPEMIANFCQIIANTELFLMYSAPEIVVAALLYAQQFHNKELMQAIDDSEGMRVFSEAYLDDLCKSIAARQLGDIKGRLDEFERNKGNY